jgi:hypothetical protein
LTVRLGGPPTYTASAAVASRRDPTERLRCAAAGRSVGCGAELYGSDTRRISILYLLDLDGPAGLCPPGPTYARAQSTLVADTSSGMHARIPRWDPGMRIPVQVCAYLSIPGLGSPDWVTLDSVTSNTQVTVKSDRTTSGWPFLSSPCRLSVSKIQNKAREEESRPMELVCVCNTDVSGMPGSHWFAVAYSVKYSLK